MAGMIRYLLDTNVLSEPVKPRPDGGVERRFAQSQGQCATAALVWHELMYGCQRLAPGRRRSELERYLEAIRTSQLRILPYDAEAARLHVGLRAALEPEGVVTSHSDGAIASIALLHDLTVVTRNVRHFTVFPGLSVEDWFSGDPH